MRACHSSYPWTYLCHLHLFLQTSTKRRSVNIRTAIMADEREATESIVQALSQFHEHLMYVCSGIVQGEEADATQSSTAVTVSGFNVTGGMLR